MFISQTYSHRGALKELEGTPEWQEIKDSISSVNLNTHKNKVSKEKNRKGDMLISPSSVNSNMATELESRGWCKKRRTFWFGEDLKLFKESFYLSEEIQKAAAGSDQHHSYMEVDFWKNHVGMEVQFGKYAFIMHDYVKMKIFYDLGLIDYGIELVPSRNMKKEMSSGPCYFEQAQMYLFPLESFLDFPILVVGVEEEA